jgi:hypothetical protein
MLSTLAPPSVESSRRILFRLRKMITNHIDLLEVSSRLGVTLSTLRKVLSGGPISPFIQKKIGRALEGFDGKRPGEGKNEPDPSPRKRSNVERLFEVHHLYQERGTLQRVADEIGLSRERVRQLLVKGAEFGLFEYKPLLEVALPPEKILADYRKFLTLKGVAQANRLSIPRLQRLLKVYRITGVDLKEIWIEVKKEVCAERYDAIAREWGHHPTTTELQRVHSTHYLTTQIRRMWGSIEAFRRDRKIPPFSRSGSAQKSLGEEIFAPVSRSGFR